MTSFPDIEVPQDWEIATLGDIADIRLGRTPPRKEKEYWDNGKHPWVAISDLDNGRIRRTRELVSDAAMAGPLKGKIAEAGTLLMSFKLTIGKVGILTMPAGHNEAIAAILPEPGVAERDFLFFALQALDYWRYKDSYVKGATLSKKKLIALPMLMPPLPEQRAIARVLRTVQQAQESTQQVIDAARELKRSLMRHLFSFGPVPIDQVETVELEQTDFGPVSSDWDIRELDEVAVVQTGIAKGGSKKGKGPVVSVPYLRVANVQDGYLDLSEIKEIDIPKDRVERYRVQTGDVLLTEGGDIDKLGRGAIWNGEVEPCVHQNHIFAVRPKSTDLLPTYLAYLVQGSYAKSYFLRVGHRTTNLASINTTKLKAFPAILPPLDTQEEIAQLLSVVDEKIIIEEQRLDALDSLFSSLLSDLMSCQVRVPESMWESAA